MRIKTSRGIHTIVFLLTAFLCLAAASAAFAAKDGVLGVEPGSLAPDFTLQNGDGKWVSLSDFRGKKVFLFSWATWCRCREQLPELEKFYKQYKSDEFEVIAVASDSQGFEWVRPYLEGAGATYVALVDPNHELARKYDFLATENGFLIDEGGVIRMSVIGFDIRNEGQRKTLVELMAADFKAEAAAANKVPMEQQIKALQEKLAAAPDSISIRMELAELHRQSGDYASAEKLLREVTEKKKKLAEAWFRLGVVIYQQGRTDEAVAMWERAYRNDTGNYIYMRTIEAWRDPEKFYKEMMDK